MRRYRTLRTHTREPRLRARRGLAAACLLLLGLLPGCSGDVPPAGPPPPASPPVSFGTRLKLSLRLPAGYVLNSEDGRRFEVHHVWRKHPVPLKQDANLAIYLGAVAPPHCPDPDGRHRAMTPEKITSRTFSWRRCRTTMPGLMALEAFQPGTERLLIHLIIVGSNRREMRTLQAIAETLQRH